ncbi:TetR/AcrR family transcriptional regulator [Kribbella sp. NBC_01245]|uniref:TetR/AcrR family transcriptional regulator n=1 Tax=Kribbella sp. NBC_01245 TaxID=2903578 RepID=UPI002E2B443A|nr:TetR/AcrR family transcriptional regulator [Kribbella sp. NBC_01245]
MSEPRSRRERPAKPALSRDGIIATAVELMNSEGLQRVTMRRLAQELDTGPASLYVYVRNTAELHAAVLDELLIQVDLTPATTAGKGAGDWEDRVVRILTSYTTVLFSHPGLAQSALVTRPSGRRYLALLEALLALLSDGGVKPARSAWLVDLLLLFGTAAAAEQASRSRAVDTADLDDALAAAISGASPATYPQVAGLGAELLSGPGPDRLAWGFRVLLRGVTHTPRPGEST